MPLGDVRDFVRQHAGELRFVLRRRDCAAMDPHRSARQRKRVDLPVVRDRERVGIFRAPARATSCRPIDCT